MANKNIVKFAGYADIGAGRYQPQYIIHGHAYLPDNIQVGFYFLKQLGFKLPKPPNYFKWRHERIKQALKNLKFLRLPKLD